MIPLEADDIAHAAWVDRLADAAHLTPGAFRQLRVPRVDHALGDPLSVPIKRMGVVVGGGPAPDTNGVIAAVAMEAIEVGARRSDFMTDSTGS